MRQVTRTPIIGLFRSSMKAALALAASAAILAPGAVAADDRQQAEGTIAVSFTYSSATNYCEGDGISVEAQGSGTISGLGPLFLTVKKCLSFPEGSVAVYQGTFSMTVGNSDTLYGTYTGTQDFSLSDASGFGRFQGRLRFTGGTGKLRHATGALTFDAVGSPNSASVDATGAPSGSPVNGMAYYLVRGTMSSPDHK